MEIATKLSPICLAIIMFGLGLAMWFNSPLYVFIQLGELSAVLLIN